MLLSSSTLSAFSKCSSSSKWPLVTTALCHSLVHFRRKKNIGDWYESYVLIRDFSCTLRTAGRALACSCTISFAWNAISLPHCVFLAAQKPLKEMSSSQLKVHPDIGFLCTEVVVQAFVQLAVLATGVSHVSQLDFIARYICNNKQNNPSMYFRLYR